MNTQTNYKKISSYEGREGEIKKVLLLYSGGLDTSVMLKWIQEQYKVEVIALVLNLGQQHDNLEAVRKKALKLGAVKAIALDVTEEFANDFIAKGIKANVSYQGEYHLSTPIGRAILGKKAVEIAKKEGADCIAHGCTGKGNDQVRIEGYILAHDPDMKIIAPVREWGMDRNEEIKYAEKNKIPVPASIDFPYSVDDNMWGMTWEGGEIDDPKLIAPVERFLTTYTLPENAPSKAENIKLTFKKGIPTHLNGEKMTLAKLIMKLNKIAGKHGVGVAHLVEDRLVGTKNGGIYELPAAHTIVTAHRALEKYVSPRLLNELKETMDTKWGYLCYAAYWFDPVMDAMNAFNDHVNENVNGTVTIKLFKGQATVVAMDSEYGLAHNTYNLSQGYQINVNASAGFIEIYTAQMKIAHQMKLKMAKKTSK